jgi:predicted nucleic acid-binding protein
MNGIQSALPWTWLHELEFRNAIRLQVFQGRINEQVRDHILRLQRSDIASGIYDFVTPPALDVSREAEELSAAHTAVLGVRSLDILHVAQALVLGISDFLTFDKRQSDLARAAGLRAPKL